MSRSKNVRNKIEFVYGRDGVLLKHPSGVEVFESKQQVQDDMMIINADIADLQSQKITIQRDLIDKIDAAKTDIKKGQMLNGAKG